MPRSPKNTRFIDSGDQGCVFKNFPAATTTHCDLPDNVHIAGDLVTKVLSNKDAYEKEVAAAEILQRQPNARNFTVYASKACSVNLEALDDTVKVLLNECHDNNVARGKKKIDFSRTAYIIEMPYVPHVTLKELATSYSIDHATGRQYFRELEKAITYLHNWGICHSDLHYENVWIVGMDPEAKKSGHIVIADFGTAKFSNDAKEKADDIRSAIPSFKAIWTAVSDKGIVRPADIERQINGSGAFFNWSIYETFEHQRPRFVASPVGRDNLFGTPSSPSSRRRRQRSSASASRSPITKKLAFEDSP